MKIFNWRGKKRNILGSVLAGIFFLVLWFGWISPMPAVVYDSRNPKTLIASVEEILESGEEKNKIKEKIPPKHLATPRPLKGIYMTSWVASTLDWREQIIKMIDKTEINALVVDVKDYTGNISFLVDNEELKKVEADLNRIRNVREFVNDLHHRNIYIIARIAVFQDPYFVKIHPELAVQSKAHAAPWKDKKGLTWIDVCARDYWDYTIAVAKESVSQGFDEINFDYIRFPSDGVIDDMTFIHCPSSESKADSLENFFRYLKENMKDAGVPISADLFGLTTTADNGNDLNIGQIIERAAPHFDYIAPMVYPSHYPRGFDGYKNPADHPYEIIFEAMQSAGQKLEAVGISKNKLRPWLQDFDLGADYNADMVRAQKKAVYDAGLTSWLMWDPRVEYTEGAYDVE